MAHFIIVTPHSTSSSNPAPQQAIQVNNIFEIIPNPTPADESDFGCTIAFTNGSIQVQETMEEIVAMSNGSPTIAKQPPSTSSVMARALEPARDAPLSDTAPIDTSDA